MPEEKTLNIQPPKRIVQMGVFVLTMLGVYLVALALTTFNDLSHPTTPPANVITVSGTGQTSIAPDIARVTFSVQNEASTVAEAQTTTTKQGNAAIAYVKQQGIADKDVTTLSYNVSPQYSYSTCPPGVLCPSNGRITGYQVSETIQVTIRNLDKVSTLLSGLGSQNVQNINGPNFTLESPTAGQDAARALAIADAKTQAKLLAKQLGVSLGRIVSFNEGGNYPVYNTMSAGYGAKAMDVGAPAPTIPVGENDYTSTVSITYEIR